MKCKDVMLGNVFKCVDSTGERSLMQQSQFIKLQGKQNVVNVATWMAAHVDEEAEVVVLGTLELKEESVRSKHKRKIASK
jgi:hypothetical protein